MRRILSLALLAASLLCAPASARILAVKVHTNAEDACEEVSGKWSCTFLGAILQAPVPASGIDTIVIPRASDSARMVWWSQRMVDVTKPVVLIDSSFLATGNVRYQLEGLGLRFLASPVRIEGFSFTRTGQNLSSVSLMGPGPDLVTRNLFNLTPSDSGTGGNYSMYGVLVGADNMKSRITDNKFGIFGTLFSVGRAITVYGDSILITNNHFGMTKSGQPVLFNASAVDVSSFRATGADTSHASVGGTVTKNRIAGCFENSGGIALGGSPGQGGTRGWIISENKFGVSNSDSTKLLAGCTTPFNETYSAIVLSTSASTEILTGNIIQDNQVWVAANGIVLRGPSTTGNIVRRNRIGSPNETVTTPIIYFNGIFVHGGARANTIDSNTIGGANTGIRFGWGTGYGNGLDNLVRGNLVGAVSSTTSPTNDTGVSLGYTSAGNLFENNLISGNRHHGMVFGSPFLESNRIERNHFGLSATGALRPNGGSAIRSVAGAGRQIVRGNVFGPSTSWGVHVASSTSRATVLDSNRFMAGQDSGAIIAQGSDSVRILDNVFEGCSVACVQLRGSKLGVIARNRFGGTNPALIARNHPTQSWLVTTASLDGNVLPSIPTPIDLIGTTGSSPNDRGPMRNLIAPLLQAATAQVDSIILTYNLDSTPQSTAPRLHVYARLPDSTVLHPLGSWPAAFGVGKRLAFVPRIGLPAGTRLRISLTDGEGNASKVDSGKVISGGVSLTPRTSNSLGRATRWAPGRLMLQLDNPSQIRWETKTLDGRIRHQAQVNLQAGEHILPIPAGQEPSILRVYVNGKPSLLRLISQGTP